jgi:hypothetical protein
VRVLSVCIVLCISIKKKSCLRPYIHIQNTNIHIQSSNQESQSPNHTNAYHNHTISSSQISHNTISLKCHKEQNQNTTNLLAPPACQPAASQGLRACAAGKGLPLPRRSGAFVLAPTRSRIGCCEPPRREARSCSCSTDGRARRRNRPRDWIPAGEAAPRRGRAPAVAPLGHAAAARSAALEVSVRADGSEKKMR